MRITHVITEARPMGGAQIDTFNAAMYQSERHDVEIVAGTGGQLADECASAGLKFVKVPIVNRVVAPIQDLVSLARLVRYFRASSPDIVHTHSSKAGLVGRVAARLTRVPIVVHTYHGPSFHDSQPGPIQMVLRWSERLCAGLSDGLVAVSRTTADEFTAAGINKPITIVMSGLDFSRFPAKPFANRSAIRMQLGVQPNELLVISVAHLMRDKGHDHLIEAALLLRHATPPMKFAIVGTGVLEWHLTEQIESAGLQDLIRLVGYRDDVPDILASADIFVQTSSREGLSRSLIEAMYSGLAIVATDVGATKEVVIDGQTGMLIAPDSSAILAETLGRLASDREQCEKLGAGAHDAISSDRSMQAMGKELQSLYGRLQESKKLSSSGTGGRSIVFVTDDMDTGGTERHLLRLAPRLAARGWVVSIFLLSRTGSLLNEVDPNIKVVGPARPSGKFYRIRKLSAFPSLYMHLKRDRPDVMASYLVAPNILGSVAARLVGVPVVISNVRDRHKFGGARRRLYRVLKLFADQLSDAVVAVSPSVAEQSAADGTPRNKLRVVSNSVVTVDQGRTEIVAGSPVVGCVARLNVEKGQRYLIDAIAAARPRLPDVRLMIVGNGDDRTMLEERVRALGLMDCVTFLGFRDDVERILPNFDIFVLASLREGLPNALMEAMSAGLPAIASRLPGTEELIEDGVTGILVPAADVDALTEAIVRLGTDSGMAAEMGRNARDVIRKRFGDVEREVAEMEAVYLSILEPSASTTRTN